MLIADSLGYRVDSLSVIPTVITLLSETESKPNCQKDESVSLWKTGVSLTRCQIPAALLLANRLTNVHYSGHLLRSFP